MSKPTDYRRLLVLYMARVIDNESVAFLEYYGRFSGPKITEREMAILKEIETEARKEWNL